MIRAAARRPPVRRAFGIIRSVSSTSTWCSAGELERLLAVLRDEHLEARALEHLPHEAADDVLVLDDEHRVLAACGGLGVGGRSDRPRGSGTMLPRIVHAAEVDRERRADADLALDLDVAAALLDDPVDRRQAEPGALVRRPWS